MDWLKDLCLEFHPCGSRVTCNPPPMDTDADYIVLIGPDTALQEKLADEGWDLESDEHYKNAVNDGFVSWRKGGVNLIVTRSTEFFQRHTAATHVCKTLNLLNKPDRIMVFQAVLYGRTRTPNHELAFQPIESQGLIGDDLR